MNKDPYQVLGVSQGATDDEIKAAYRKLAKQFHPDLNNGSAAAETKMKEINEAYTLLIKSKGQGGFNQNSSGQRQGYGQSGYGGYGGFGGNGNGYGSSSGQRAGYTDWSDIFGGFGGFGGNGGQSATGEKEADSPELEGARSAILGGEYQKALFLLGGIANKTADWYYWSARANMGLGNRVAALNDAKTAAAMNPDSFEYRQLLSRLQATGQQYQRQGARYGLPEMLCQNPCLTMCLANAICNCFCGGRMCMC